jgi:hypothetical protein
MTFNLSQTVGSVELSKAAISGFHASSNNKSKLLGLSMPPSTPSALFLLVNVKMPPILEQSYLLI